MSTIKIGVDVGNYDTKTQKKAIPSGYKKYTTYPAIAKKVLSYKDAYYVTSIGSRIPYVQDKTENDQCIILTLIAIAEEIISQIKEKGCRNIQEEITNITDVKLGVGLPPGHFNRLSKKTGEYYMQEMGDGITFDYAGYHFSFSVSRVRVLPQDFVAVFKNKMCEIPKNHKKYYIVGIGGGTADIIPVVDGAPDVNNCFSLVMGTRVMYNHIARSIQLNTGVMLDEYSIENVLRNENTVLKEDMCAMINEGAKNHFEEIINTCIQDEVKLDLYPVVFYGGGCALLRKYIESSSVLTKYEIIDDVHANAIAYAACLD